MSDFNSIGFFQFDNLLQSRTPFLLLLLDEIDLKPNYNSLVHMHLDIISSYCSSEKALGVVQEKNLPNHYAIIVLDLNGKKSPLVAKSLESAGFINVYYVKNGFTAFSKE